MALRTLRLGPVALETGVYGAAVALLLSGLVVTDQKLHWVALLSYAVAGGLLLWGTTIHRRHLWQQWWKGPPYPFEVSAWSAPFKYGDGISVAGIRWNKAFAHIRVNITNISDTAVDDVNAYFVPDQPIIHSRAQCDFADCKIEMLRTMVDLTLRLKTTDGRTVDIPPSEQLRVAFGPPHRMICGRLPAGATIEVNLATVVPSPGKMNAFEPEATEPESIFVEVRWPIDDRERFARMEFDLKRTT